MSEPDLRVVWYRAPRLGVEWHPEIVGSERDAERCRETLRHRFRRSGGVETMVKEYAEVVPPTAETPESVAK